MIVAGHGPPRRWSPRPRMRPASSASARRCRRPTRGGCARRRSSSRRTSSAYREKSRDVWEIVREPARGACSRWGIDEAYADLTGRREAAAGPARGDRAGASKDTGIQISGRRRPVAAGRQVLLGPAASPRASWPWAARRRASASRRRPRAGSRASGPKTAERLAELGYATVGQLQEADEAQLAARFGDRWARYLKARATVPRRLAGGDRESGAAKSVSTERTFDTDIEGPRRARDDPAQTLSKELCEGPRAKKGRRGPDGRDQGPPRRTGRRSPAPRRSTARRNDVGARDRDGPRPAARLRAAAARPPARRPPGRASTTSSPTGHPPRSRRSGSSRCRSSDLA